MSEYIVPIEERPPDERRGALELRGGASNETRGDGAVSPSAADSYTDMESYLLLSSSSSGTSCGGGEAKEPAEGDSGVSDAAVVVSEQPSSARGSQTTNLSGAQYPFCFFSQTLT